MNLQDAGIGAAIMGFFGVLKSYFSSAQRQKIAQMKLEANVKAAADIYINKVTVEYDDKIKKILEQVARQTEEIHLLRQSIETLSDYFKIIVGISKEHIKDDSIVSIIDKIDSSATDLFKQNKRQKIS